MGLLDPVLCCEAVSNLWACRQRYGGVGVAHGDIHLQVLPVSPQAPPSVLDIHKSMCMSSLLARCPSELVKPQHNIAL